MRKKHRGLHMLAEGAAAAGIACCGTAAAFAHSLARPQCKTLEEEKDWEIERGLWGDFDSTERTPYIVQGKDGYLLHCEYVEYAPGSRDFVILTHGYTSNRYGSVKYLESYRSLGFNCIIYDCRGHGENEKAACSIGNLEAQDLLRVIADTYERYGTDIRLGLHGESMGSSASLNVLKYRPDVRFVVADCGFANLYDLIGTWYREAHIGFMLDPVNAAMRLLYGFDMKETSARDALKDNQVPLCLFHGRDDKYIPPENSEELAGATAGYCEVHLIDGARHAKSRRVIGAEAYAQIIRGFLEEIGYF